MKLNLMLERAQKAIRFRKHFVFLGNCTLIYNDYDDYIKNVFNDLKLHGFTRPRFKDGCLYATQPK